MIDNAQPLAMTPGGRFFRWLDWSAFWTTTLIVFGVYFATMAPTVTLEDSGELATGGDYLGVPHPPGYPSWTAMVWLFARAFEWVTFMGQPNPAWAIALASVVFGALAAGMTAMLICRSGADLLAKSQVLWQETGDKAGNAICWVGGVVGSLLFAFSPAMWSQSVIVEVYSLNAFFLILVFLLLYRWISRPSDKILFILSYVFGLGLTNYQVLLLAALALGVAILFKDFELGRDYVIAGVVFLATIGIMQLASMPSMPGFPKHQFVRDAGSALIAPGKYMIIFVFTSAAVVSALVGCVAQRAGRSIVVPALVTVFTALTAFAIVHSIDSPPPIAPQEGQEVFSWFMPTVAFLGMLVAIVALCAFLPGGMFLASAFVIIDIVLGLLCVKGALLSLTHPTTVWFSFYVFLNFVYLGIFFFFLPRGKTVSLSILFTQLGAAFYVFMPIVSDLRNPPMNWGYPRTWEGFKHAITRGQYEKIAPSDVFSMNFLMQIGGYLADLRRQFTLPLALLGFLPFCSWRLKAGKFTLHAIIPAAALAILATLLISVEEIIMSDRQMGTLDYIPAMSVAYKVLIAGIIFTLITGGFLAFVKQLRDFISKAMDSTVAYSQRMLAALIILGIAGIAVLYVAHLAKNLQEVMEPMNKAGQTLTSEQSRDIVLSSAGIFLTILAPFALGLLITWLMQSPLKLSLSYHDDTRNWLISLLAGFTVMSVVLIALANPKGDVQDDFIQRVKFISSHGLYAFWIGYGLIIGLALVNVFLGKIAVVRWLSYGVALLMPLVPIRENYFNKELIRLSGGADQDHRDFGWQFGNYELRGADAIREELAADEEPLPNPFYPPEMGRDAIFYGGTDPGRFVPTYMIYSAHVREDVFLITQNALADNTYMSVMRDLYGDRIWIPTPPDSAEAFKRYVDEVRAGIRQPHAELKIENGRVQVSGAIGVMEINGILAQMIFEHNKYRHDFYVEESYVIQWMYTYLEPHGLIMKIKSTPSVMTPQMALDDMRFWDWYSRRLTSHPEFAGDVVARKSFSKLRSAIAGLYTRKGFSAEAEQAFQEARILYPLSPEANFRLCQEVYMARTENLRFADAREVMKEFAKQDPGNKSVIGFTNQITQLETSLNRMRELEQKLNRININETFELLDLLIRFNRVDNFMSIANSIAAASNAPWNVHFSLAQLYGRVNRREEMTKCLDSCLDRFPPNINPNVYRDMINLYSRAGKMDRMAAAMSRYLQRVPSDWRGWLEMSLMNNELKKSEEAMRALEQAVRTGGSDAINAINQMPQFAPVRDQIMKRSQNLAPREDVGPLRRPPGLTNLMFRIP